MIRQDTRLLTALLVFLALMITWLVMAGHANPRSYRSSSVPEEYPPLPRRPSPQEARPERRLLVVSKWLRELLADAGIPVVQEVSDADDKRGRGCILHGKLIWEGKPWLPLKGVEVRVTDVWLDTIVPTEKREPHAPLLLPPRSTTDRWGKFVLRNVPTRKTLFLLVRDGNRTLTVKKLLHLPLSGQMLNLYEIEVPEQGTLKGRVVDEEGQVLRGITVRAVSDPLNRGPLRDDRMETRRVERSSFFRARGQSGPSVVPQWVVQRDRLLPFPSTLTTSDGTFLLRGARAGQTALMIRGERLVALREVDVEANETTDVGTVVAAGGVAFQAFLADGVGRPVVSAQVSIQPQDWPITMEPVTTDVSGHFDGGYIPGDRHTVFVKTTDSQIWEIARPSRRPWRHRRARGRPVYELAWRLTGLIDVVDPAGRPVMDAMASLSYLDSGFTRAWVQLPGHVKALESQPGSFGLHNLPWGHTLRLVVAAPDHAPAVLKVDVDTRAGPFQPGGLRIRLRQIFPVRFQVRGANDTPIANASVSVMFQKPPKHALPGTDDHLLSGGGAVLGHTDENGVLEVSALWRSPAWFAAWHPDYGLTPTQLIRPLPGMVVPIRLRPIGRVAGELTFGGDQPSARWIIRARPVEYFSSTYDHNPFFPAYRTVTSPDGSFYFNELFEGGWRLSLHRLAPDATRPWSFRWPEGERNEVQVVAGMTVLHQWDVPADRGRYHVTGTVRMDGRPLAHAVVRLHVVNDTSDLESVLEATKQAIRRVQQKKPRSRDEKRLNRKRQRQLELLHRVMLWTRKVPPAERFPEDVFVTSRHAVAAIEADAEGRFDIAVRQPGCFEVRLADPQGKQELARARAAVTRAKDGRRAEVHFKVQTGSLRLTLTTHETIRICKRTVRLTQEPAGAIFRLRADHQGDVFVPRIPAGKYRLTIDGRGVRGARVKNPIVNITAGTLSIHHAYTDPYSRVVEPVK